MNHTLVDPKRIAEARVLVDDITHFDETTRSEEYMDTDDAWRLILRARTLLKTIIEGERHES